MAVAKSKTCIVCGEAAGSKEHVFPASMGGRRTNSGIYCHAHDNGYSGLVAELGSQLDIFNAYLGVSSDHTKQKKVIKGIDSKSGFEIAISADVIEFTKPRVMSETLTENGREVSMNFPNEAKLREWQKERAAEGTQITIKGQVSTTKYFPGVVHHKKSFGGPIGLGAMAYLMQTFFAQEFPEIARSGAIANFIAYTQAIAKVANLGGKDELEDEGEMLTAARDALAASLIPFDGEPPVWWDLAAPPNVSPNGFAFGHRVIVGVDHADGLLYARFALFDTLRFAACLGNAEWLTSSSEWIIDIDPLALHPPHDIIRSHNESASGVVSVSVDRTEDLIRVISDGTQQNLFADLLRRMEDHQLLALAKRMALDLEFAPGLGAREQRALLERVVDSQSQQVWLLMSHVMSGLATHFRQGGEERLAKVVDLLIAEDGNSGSGLSQLAEVCLTVAKAALMEQMGQDLSDNVLDADRIAALMGRGAGMHLVGTALSQPLLSAVGTAAK
jgi:hypothetical protein